MHIAVVLGDLCDNIGLVVVFVKWSYVTASLSCLLCFLCMLAMPFLKFDLLVLPPFFMLYTLYTCIVDAWS